MALYSQNIRKHTNALFGQNGEFFLYAAAGSIYSEYRVLFGSE
jgi:hypothetical protein